MKHVKTYEEIELFKKFKKKPILSPADQIKSILNTINFSYHEIEDGLEVITSTTDAADFYKSFSEYYNHEIIDFIKLSVIISLPPVKKISYKIATRPYKNKDSKVIDGEFTYNNIDQYDFLSIFSKICGVINSNEDIKKLYMDFKKSSLEEKEKDEEKLKERKLNIEKRKKEYSNLLEEISDYFLDIYEDQKNIKYDCNYSGVYMEIKIEREFDESLENIMKSIIRNKNRIKDKNSNIQIYVDLEPNSIKLGFADKKLEEEYPVVDIPFRKAPR